MREQDFLNHFLRKGYFKKHAKVVLALSGGLDSMFLFKVLSTYKKELEIELILAHVNHKQRVESDWEEKELRKLAVEAGLPIYVSNFQENFQKCVLEIFVMIFSRGHEKDRCDSLSHCPPCG